jgi:transcriptional antiterminator RfaH
VLDIANERRFARRRFTPVETADPEHGPRWYAVHTLPCREFGARAQLEAQAYRIFLPRHLKTVRHARKLRTIDAPFFPRYLFVSLDLARDRWRSINGTFGVAGIIMAHDRPLPVPRGIVEALQRRLERDVAAPCDDGLRLGQSVEVMVGPFANLVGTLERFDGEARVRVLLQLMGTFAPVSLSRDSVVARLV